MVQILEEKSITISEVRKILEEKEAELDEIQRRALDFARKFARLELGKAREIVERLTKEFDLTVDEAVQIVNCMPSSVEELRIFFPAGKRRILIEPRLKDMIKLLSEYASR